MAGARVLMFPLMPRTKYQPDRAYPNRVREFRMAAELTLKELAEKSGLFFTQIGKIELGERPAKDFELRALGKALDVDPADLLNLDEGGLAPEERLMVDTYREISPALKRSIMALIEAQQVERGQQEVVELPRSEKEKPAKKAG